MKKLKKFLPTIAILLIIIIALCLIIFEIYNSNLQNEEKVSETVNNSIISNNEKPNIRAIIVKVNDDFLDAINPDNTNELYSISFGSEGNIGFKQGQEILVYFDGMINETYPEQINNVEKIEIVKEESEVKIPNDILRYYYSSKNIVEK